MDLTQPNETWCIEDTLFYPLGLINHTTGNKTVFVTWNEKYLMNFIFKKIDQNTNRCNKFMINVSEEILDVIILEVNTLVLLITGELCYFSSIKSVQRIPWLNEGVRCVSGSLAGFSIIRVLEDNRINLELYQDVLNIGKCPQECIRSFDLTFDENNLFDSDWSDEMFSLTSIQITDSNRKFMELLVREADLQVDEIHLFSMSNQIYALVPKDQEEYEIKTLAPQVSTVELVKFLEKSNMLLIFLKCGIIEVWYLSRIAWLLEKYTYINGSQFVHYTFAGEVLFFTDEQKVCRLNFTYDSIQHACEVLEQSIDAPGMVAVTYVEESSSLVCLNNNNIFYHLTFEDEQQDKEAPEDPQIFELTNQKVQEMMKKSNQFQDITTLPGKIENLIEEEYKKQELIAVSKKSSIYSELISAEVSFSQHIPDTPQRIIYPSSSGLPPFTYFAIVSIKILSHEIFKTTIWNLMIAYSSNVRLLRLTTELLQQKFNILIPIKKNCQELIPDIEIQLLTYVNIEQDFVCINIPVKVQEVNVQKLFSRNQGLGQPSMTLTSSRNPFSFKITCPKLHVNHVCAAFGLPDPSESENLEDEVLVENLYFLGEAVRLLFCEPLNTVRIESSDPVAIYYAKICLKKYIFKNFQTTPDHEEKMRKSLLEIQCQIEKKYGTLTDGESHLDNLKSAYEKLRKEIVWKF